jgi:hypothetical protein
MLSPVSYWVLSRLTPAITPLPNPFLYHRYKASSQFRKSRKKAKSEKEMLSTVKKCQNLALCNNSGCNVVV